MEVDVEVEGGAEPLDEGYSTGVTGCVGEVGLLENAAGDCSIDG